VRCARFLCKRSFTSSGSITWWKQVTALAQDMRRRGATQHILHAFSVHTMTTNFTLPAVYGEKRDRETQPWYIFCINCSVLPTFVFTTFTSSSVSNCVHSSNPVIYRQTQHFITDVIQIFTMATTCFDINMSSSGHNFITKHKKECLCKRRLQIWKTVEQCNF
jgi:hypothetical protein